MPPLTTNTPVLKWNFPNLVGTPQQIKAGPTVLYGLYVLNTTAATCFVQVFDQAQGGVTPGTTVPDLQISCLTVAAAFIPIPSTAGVQFNAGIQVISTTAVSGGTGSASGVFVYALYL